MSPLEASSGVNAATYVDEEECLPFPIFIAELELLVGNSKRGKPDGVQLLELLQKLVATIPRTDKPVMKQYQRQCETMLYDVLVHGVGAAVRRLIYSCFSSLYAHGDSVSIYTRVGTLLSYLSSKEGMSRSTAEAIRVGLLDFLAHLVMLHGRMLAASAQESIGIASRTVSKYGNQTAVRCAALRLATAVVRGLSPQDRSAAAVHAEAWAVIQRHGKERTSEEVRAGCLALLSALCGAGAGVLWREGAYGAEEALRLCLGLADDPVQVVREAAWRALGELAAASRGSVAAEAMTAEKRPAKKAAAERVVGGCVRACLVTPLVDAAVHNRREACLAAGGAWLSYISSLPRHREGHDHTADLMEVAAMLVNAVSEAGRLAAEARAATPPDAPVELGAGLAGGELPPLQACALYVLRRGVISGLAEAAQRKLLERLALTLDKRLSTPAVVVLLEALATLLEALGEVTEDTAATLERALQPHIASASSATRQQAAVALAALAAAHPAAAARMLSGCLDTITTCAAQMAVSLSPAASGSMDAASLSRPSTPRNGSSSGGAPEAASAVAANSTTAAVAGAAAQQTGSSVSSGSGIPLPSSASGRLSPAQRSLMDTAHGAALAAARLLLTAARAPLGCPARLQRRALALAEDLVTGPGPQVAASRAICREVGFLLLGSLCSLGVPQATRGSEEIASLWRTALGETARKELDERSYLRPGGDLDLAVQLWWRSIALQALSAYIASPAATAPAGSMHGTNRNGGAPYRSIASMPSLSTTSASFSMRSLLEPSGQPGLRSSGSAGAGLGADAAAAVAAADGDVAGQLAPLVLPLLDLLDTQPYLQDPARARGGPGGVLAGASAMFALSLLELHLRAPAGRIGASPQHMAALAKTCLRPFRLGLAPASADALTLCALRGLLSADDAPLGPWPAGLDAHEEALRTYTGARGGPYLPPWLTAEEHAAMLTGGTAVASGPSAASGGSPYGHSAAGAVIVADGHDEADGIAEAAGAGTLAGTASASGGHGLGSGTAGSAATERAHVTYPQPLGLEVALLSAQLVLLGRLLGSAPVPQQLQILEVILGAVQAAKTLARQSRDAPACQRLPLGVAAAVVTLAAYGPGAMASRRSRAPLDPSDKVPEKLLLLAQTLMPDEHAAAPDAAPLARAAAELFAASAAAGSDAWALRVVRSLASEAAASAAEGRDSERRGVVAVALGAAHRARGGLAMQGAVAGSVEGLVAAASRPGNAAGAAWVLHGLWLVASSSGGAFVPRVRTSLQLGQELLVSSYESPALRAACARLANAAVAVLGPEFSLGSAVYARAKSLVAASGGVQDAAAVVTAAGGGTAEGAVQSESAAAMDGADGGLGLVLFVQQIILFAPHAVPPRKHVPLFLSHLLSHQPDLRAASALTLRHLAERSAEALPPVEAAPLLFAALDRETDTQITSQLRATLTTILTASASTQPSFWLSLLSDVVFAAGPPSAAAADAGGADADAPRGGDDDDDDKYGQPAAAAAATAAPAAASSSGVSAGAEAAAGSGGVKALRSVRDLLSAPHLRTRLFAADGLLRLVRICVSSDERHRDPAALEARGSEHPASSTPGTHAGNAAAGWASAFGADSSSKDSSRLTGVEGSEPHRDVLIAKLQALVDVGFKLATCPLESLRPHGVRLLTMLVVLFGDVPDPLLQGARLMEQYQAQVVSALRSSLGARQVVAAGGLRGPAGGASGGAAAAVPPAAPAASESTAQHPLLQIAGGALATCFLESGLAAGDAVVMRRLMDLLSAPLAAWDTLHYQPYAEWVGARARVELLRAHAQCAAIAAAAAARGDTLCAGIVAKAHEPHAARLQALWALLLQDHAVLSSQPEEVLAAYRSPLLGGEVELRSAPAPPAAASTAAAAAGAESDGGAAVAEPLRDGDMAAGMDSTCSDGSGGGLAPALAAVLRPVYAAACPAAMAALAGSLPPATQVAADMTSRAQFRRVLEVGLMLLTDASARVAHAMLGVTGGVGFFVSSGGSVHALNGDLNPLLQRHSTYHYQRHGSASSAIKAGSEVVSLQHVRDTVTRLTGMLRALQRLLAPSYLAATVGGACTPAYGGTSSNTADGCGSPAAAAGVEPLVPTAVLRDVLGLLSTTAAHALLPLQWAVLGGVLPTSLATQLQGLVLPCCALVREVCSAWPEELLGVVSEPSVAAGLATTDAQPASNAHGTVSPNSPGSCPRKHMDAEGGQGVASPMSNRCTGGGASAETSVTAACVETILLLASVCAPYGYDTPAGRYGGSRASNDGGSAAAHEAAPADCSSRFPSWLLPARSPCSSPSSTSSGDGGSNLEEDVAQGCMRMQVPGCSPLPAATPEHAAAMAQGVVQVLAAAQQLVRRAPWPSLEPHLGSLLELPLRLILTTAPGTPIVGAAQRFLDNAVAALAAGASTSPQPTSGSAAETAVATAAPASSSPAAYAAAAVVALSDAADLHLKALQRQDGRGESSSGSASEGAYGRAQRTNGNEQNGAPSHSLLSGRFAALVVPLLACTASVFTTESPSSATTSHSAHSSHSHSGSSHRTAAGFGLGSGSRSGSASGSGPSRSSSSGGSGGSPVRRRASRSGGGAAAGGGRSPGASPPPAGGRRGGEAATGSGTLPIPCATLSAAGARSCAFGVLAAALGPETPPAAAHAVLEAVRTAVQEAAAEDAASARGRWCRLLLCTLSPAAVARVGVLLAEAGQPLSGEEQALVAECVKLLVVGATLAGPQGAAAQDGVMQVLVPLLVELAAPALGPAAVTPALRDMAIKLITSLPASAAGNAFKTHLAAQPAAAKLRLQTALREAAAAAAAASTAAAASGASAGVAAPQQFGVVGAAGAPTAGPSAGAVGAAGRRPAIQLKTTFALPLPGK
ncbi:hypothetical protein Agub_g10725 [Astrephomene gubernaculifera]|uniref:Uncharacterized protein n=1 Tax=Astrephomene gubernaculifera TaxID=47775 RepID=A0AAD3HQ65_9CHLO|nr:hypothetical protein Agub_g10725 [Astrephomene gubernaculifera]